MIIVFSYLLYLQNLIWIFGSNFILGNTLNMFKLQTYLDLFPSNANSLSDQLFLHAVWIAILDVDGIE
jgi:hypothetical protein